MIMDNIEFSHLVKQYFSFLYDFNYKLLGCKDLNRSFKCYFQNKDLLVLIRYTLTNRIITIIIAYDNQNAENFSESYDSSLDFMVLFNKNDTKIYNEIMPDSVGEKESFELVSKAIKKYAMNILLGNERVTTNDLIHRNKHK
jgi:hypothetical protein